jgi:hypothetical protein
MRILIWNADVTLKPLPSGSCAPWCVLCGARQMARTGVIMAVLLVALLCCMVPLASASQRVEEDTFENIKNAPAEQVVVFYHSGEPDHVDVIKVLRKTAKVSFAQRSGIG